MSCPGAMFAEPHPQPPRRLPSTRHHPQVATPTGAAARPPGAPDRPERIDKQHRGESARHHEHIAARCKRRRIFKRGTHAQRPPQATPPRPLPPSSGAAPPAPPAPRRPHLTRNAARRSGARAPRPRRVHRSDEGLARTDRPRTNGQELQRASDASPRQPNCTTRILNDRVSLAQARDHSQCELPKRPPPRPTVYRCQSPDRLTRHTRTTPEDWIGPRRCSSQYEGRLRQSRGVDGAGLAECTAFRNTACQ